MVEAGAFRRDLFYRLNVINLAVPALRDRPLDIPLLANHFLHKFTVDHGREVNGFDIQALTLLQRHPWPGNVRELANAVERAVVMSSGNQILAEDLPNTIANACSTENAALTAEELSLKTQVRNFETQVITQALLRNQGNRSRTATELGISRRALLYKLHECQLDDKADLSDDCATSGLNCA